MRRRWKLLKAGETIKTQGDTSGESARFGPWSGRIALLGLLAWIFYAATGTTVFGHQPFVKSIVDYQIQYEQCRSIVHRGSYDARQIFPYPPSAVSLFYLTAPPDFLTAASLRLLMNVGAAFGTLALGSSLVGLRNHPLRWPVALGALAMVNFVVAWDLRFYNCNMLFCFLVAAALVMQQRERDAWAGFFLAAGIALKLFPVLLIPYFLWIGKRRAFVWASFFLLLFFGLLPLLVFRTHFVEAYTSWIVMMRNLAEIVRENRHPILISIPSMLSHDANFTPALVGWLTAGFASIWIVVGAFAFGWGSSARRTRPVEGWDLAADGGILLLTPIILSPYLEAYHFVPALLLALPLLQCLTVPGGLNQPVNIALIVAIVAGQVGLHYAGKFHIRGAGLYLQMLLMVASVAVVRFSGVPARQPVESKVAIP